MTTTAAATGRRTGGTMTEAAPRGDHGQACYVFSGKMASLIVSVVGGPRGHEEMHFATEAAGGGLHIRRRRL